MRFLISLFLTFTLAVSPAVAQETPPEPPAAIAALKQSDSTLTYLGPFHGYQTWVISGPSQKQFAYIRDGENTVISGMMTNENGKNISAEQLAAAVSEGKMPQTEILDANQGANQNANQALGDKFMSDVIALRALQQGPAGGKSIYVFMDPNCPYCKQFDQAVMKRIADGRAIQLHIIPAPILGSDSRDKTVQIYSAENPADAWQKYIADGSLPNVAPDAATKAAAEQAIEANLAVMQRWKLQMVPMIVWRNPDGRVMLNYGTPNDENEFWHAVGLE